MLFSGLEDYVRARFEADGFCLQNQGKHEPLYKKSPRKLRLGGWCRARDSRHSLPSVACQPAMDTPASVEPQHAVGGAVPRRPRSMGARPLARPRHSAARPADVAPSTSAHRPTIVWRRGTLTSLRNRT
jgi:hypothetical protein